MYRARSRASRIQKPWLLVHRLVRRCVAIAFEGRRGKIVLSNGKKKKEKKREKDVKDAEEKCVYDGSTQDILKSRWTLIFQVFIFFFLFFPSFFPFAPQRVRIQARSNEIHCTFSYMSKEKKKREHTYTYTYTHIHRYIYIHIHVRWRASCSIV